MTEPPTDPPAPPPPSPRGPHEQPPPTQAVPQYPPTSPGWSGPQQYGTPQGGPPQGGPAQGGPAQYGPQPYGPPPGGQWSPGGAYGAAPAPAPPLAGLRGAGLGPRARRRPDARFGPALAGAGAALALLGGLVWTIGYLVAGFGVSYASDDLRAFVHGDGRRFLGFGVFLALTLIGYAAVVLRRRGPLATAGTVFSAGGLPFALGFAFLDLHGAASGSDPINIDALALLSILIWLLTYLAVPGARGRAVYLALAAITLPSYVLIKAGGSSTVRLGSQVADGSLPSGGGTHAGTAAVVGLVFGLLYYAIAALLDRTGRPGVAIGLLYPAFATTLTGLIAATQSFHQIGTGIALIVVGGAVSFLAGRAGHRFTAWFWAAAVATGVLVLVAKVGSDHSTLLGVLLLVLGVVLALVAQVLGGVLREPPDVDPDGHAAGVAVSTGRHGA